MNPISNPSCSKFGLTITVAFVLAGCVTVPHPAYGPQDPLTDFWNGLIGKNTLGPHPPASSPSGSSGGGAAPFITGAGIGVAGGYAAATHGAAGGLGSLGSAAGLGAASMLPAFPSGSSGSPSNNATWDSSGEVPSLGSGLWDLEIHMPNGWQTVKGVTGPEAEQLIRAANQYTIKGNPSYRNLHRSSQSGAPTYVPFKNG